MASALSRSVFRKIAVFCLAACVVAFLLIVTTAVVFAQPVRMSATKAHSAALNGNLIILDIRSPGEWAKTGVAKDAWPVTMHDPNFGANLQSIIERYPKKPLAFICATGGRSNHVATVLDQNGILGIINISEGMFGNGKAPSWIDRDLSIVDVTVARNRYAASMLKKD